MRKFYIISICLLIFAACTQALEGGISVSTPQWSEFSPLGYQNPTVYTDEEIEKIATLRGTKHTKILYCAPDGTTAKIIRGLTVLPALDCYLGRKIAISKWRKHLYSENLNNEYWLNRKNAFENSLSLCNALRGDTKIMCYMKVRELEIQKNAIHKQELYSETIIRQNSIKNFELQDMNNNLRNIDNQLRQLNY